MEKTNRQSTIDNRQSSISAWLFDVYPSECGVTLWLIGLNGARMHFFRQFTPYFFLHLNTSDIKRAIALGARCPIPVSFKQTTHTEIYSGDSIDVLQVFGIMKNSFLILFFLIPMFPLSSSFSTKHSCFRWHLAITK
jgi:hypothetical protein